jgi:y4mF family transcriptional regulator
MVKKERTQLSQFVKTARKENKLNQVDLSEKAGVGLQFVRDLEQGKRTLRMDKVNDVLRLFGAELSPVLIDRNKLLSNE